MRGSMMRELMMRGRRFLGGSNETAVRWWWWDGSRRYAIDSRRRRVANFGITSGACGFYVSQSPRMVRVPGLQWLLTHHHYAALFVCCLLVFRKLFDKSSIIFYCTTNGKLALKILVSCAYCAWKHLARNEKIGSGKLSYRHMHLVFNRGNYR